MNTTDLFRALKKRCGGKLLGVFACDRLPARLPHKRPLILICNTHPHYKKGEHWITIYVGDDGKGEYFDSFGENVPRPFERFLDYNCAQWTRNNAQLQSALTNLCGQYCVFYSLFKCLDYSFDNILSCFSNDTMLNDYVVHKFVCDNL